MLVKPDGDELEDEDWLLVDAAVEDDLADVGTVYELILCRTANGGYFLWRLKAGSLAAVLTAIQKAPARR